MAPIGHTTPSGYATSSRGYATSSMEWGSEGFGRNEWENAILLAGEEIVEGQIVKKRLEDLTRTELISKITTLICDRDYAVTRIDRLESEKDSLESEIHTLKQQYNTYKIKLKKEKKAMSTSLAVFDPNSGNQASNSQKQQMVDYLQESKDLLKTVAGYTDEKINKIKVTELGPTLQKEMEQATVGNFEKYISKNIKKESFISTALNTFFDLFKKNNGRIMSDD